MSEATPEGGNDSGQTPAADEFKPITSQDELNEALKDRLARERSKFSDYKDVKAKADQFDKLQAANQTEAEKSAARVADLESQLANVRVESTRLRIAAENGITDADDIDLFLTGTDDETLTKQAKRLAERTADRKKNGNHVPREGATTSPGESEDRAFARELFAP